MQTLTIDVGNSRCHFAWVEGQKVHNLGAFPTVDIGTPRCQLSDFLDNNQTVPEIAFASVVPAASNLLFKLFSERNLSTYHLDRHHLKGLKLSYPKPEEIGEDRLADSIGGVMIAGAPVVVIDCGTATVFDVITDEGGYEGGIIAPGLSLMTRYLHEKTALLPLLNPEKIHSPSPFGKSTIEAMETGCIIGAAGMIERLTEHVLKTYSEELRKTVPVLITGGDANILRPFLSDRYQLVENLTLMGIAEAARLWKGS